MLSKFPNKTLKVGAKVSLAPEASWWRCSANPRGIVGRVTHINNCFGHEGGGLRVSWENGLNNSYQNIDYDLIAEGEPGYLETT